MITALRAISQYTTGLYLDHLSRSITGSSPINIGLFVPLCPGFPFTKPSAFWWKRGWSHIQSSPSRSICQVLWERVGGEKRGKTQQTGQRDENQDYKTQLPPTMTVQSFFYWKCAVLTCWYGCFVTLRRFYCWGTVKRGRGYYVRSRLFYSEDLRNTNVKSCEHEGHKGCSKRHLNRMQRRSCDHVNSTIFYHGLITSTVSEPFMCCHGNRTDSFKIQWVAFKFFFCLWEPFMGMHWKCPWRWSDL